MRNEELKFLINCQDSNFLSCQLFSVKLWHTVLLQEMTILPQVDGDSKHGKERCRKKYGALIYALWDLACYGSHPISGSWLKKTVFLNTPTCYDFRKNVKRKSSRKISNFSMDYPVWIINISYIFISRYIENSLSKSSLFFSSTNFKYSQI